MIFDSVGPPPIDTMLFWQRLPLWSTSYEDSVGVWRLDGYGEEAERLGKTGVNLFADWLTLCPAHRPSASALLDSSFFQPEVIADGRSIRHEADERSGGGDNGEGSQWSHLQERFEADGYVVVQQHVPVELIANAVEDIRARVRMCLRGYGVIGLRGDSLFDALLEVVPKFHKSPTGWPGKPFGAIDKRGWHKGLGSGRLFEDWETEAIKQVCVSKFREDEATHT